MKTAALAATIGKIEIVPDEDDPAPILSVERQPVSPLPC
jgi:hypothetical protein